MGLDIALFVLVTFSFGMGYWLGHKHCTMDVEFERQQEKYK